MTAQIGVTFFLVSGPVPPMPTFVLNTGSWIYIGPTCAMFYTFC